MADVNIGNLYDMNKMLVEQTEHPLKGKILENHLHNEAVPFLKEKIFTEKYFMLLCNEKKDYTVFHIANEENIIENILHELKICLHNRGVIYSIERTEDKMALEIWIKHDEDKQMACYYFFPYTAAVIEI